MAEGQPNISYQPSEGLSYDPSEARYWDEEALGQELERVFEVCHGCRMCFKYCDSFPRLFRFIDDRHDGDVRKLTAEETEAVVDDCFQCKLCEVQCPYTPRDGHEFQLDFPRLIHRYKAQRTRRRGLSLRERVLGDPDGTAALARASLGLANVMNRVGLHRRLLEGQLGIHRDKLLPDFAAETFSFWARETGRTRDEPGAEVVLFPTCYVENNEPQLGRDAMTVLEHNEVEVALPEGQVCCGMPSWESGDLEGLRKRARRNLEVLGPHVEAGAKVLPLQPTCAMLMRREYPELVAPEDRQRAEALAAAIRDPGEYLWGLRKEGRYKDDFKSSPSGPIAYHAPCHLRAQAVGFRGRDLLKRLPGVTGIVPTMECCGHDGTYAMTVEGFEPSRRIGEPAFEGMMRPEATTWSSDCPLAALQFEQHAGKRTLHPLTILARAYRGEAFDEEDIQ